MGLDAVELLIAVEQAFNITIPDEVAARCRTTRQLIEAVSLRIRLDPESDACLSMQAFHRLRKAYEKIPDANYLVMRPKTTLRSLVPKGRERLFWKAWERSAGMGNFPELARPIWLQILNWMITLAAGVLIALQTGLLAGIILMTPIGLVLLVATQRWRGHSFFGTNMKTVGNLVDHFVMVHPGSIRKQRKPFSRSDVRTIVRKLVADNRGTNRFSDDDDFVKDLGMD